jgi:ATP-dependent DNA helicase DinG
MSEAAVRGWISRIDQILRSRPKLKGIIHCTSYARQKDIYSLSTERRRLIWHSSWNTQAKIDEFRNTREDSGAVFISPAISTGYDFPASQCRFQIIAKIPMVDTRSKIMQARLAEDADYGDYLTAQDLTQMCGRSMRADDDWCQTLICDDHWAWWYPKMRNKRLLPEWFVRQVTPPSDGIPAVLNLC